MNRTFQILEGDCREQMKGLADNSVESIVTDPPYELGFMGKGWDKSGIAYDVKVWLECLRVLKPGGHLLAFGGSRTYHRLACAIEDAGFDIRDQIQYIYGSGFPKSLDVSKNLREQESVCICDDQRNGNRPQAQFATNESVHEHDLRFVPDSDLSEAVRVGAKSGEVLQSGVPQQDALAHGATRPESQVARRKESGMEGRRDLFPETRELCADQVRSMPAGVSGNGAEGRVRDGAPPDHGAMDRASADTNGSSSSRRSQSTEQSAHQPTSLPGQPDSQTLGAWPLCGRCGKPVVPEGIGSALKPAHEPIVVARKPFNSTLIENVLRYGTGGINVDACRIEFQSDADKDQTRVPEPVQHNDARGVYMSGTGVGRTGRIFEPAEGRWPANVITDGSEEVLAAFPDAPGQQGDLSGHSRDRLSRGIYGDFPAARDAIARLDSGSAARFYYCAKASQDDRDEGLEEVARRQRDESRKQGDPGGDNPRNRGAAPRANHHPTVKPTDLMRYLCRLVTPPKVIEMTCLACYNTPTENIRGAVTGERSGQKEAVQAMQRDVPQSSQDGEVLLGSVSSPESPDSEDRLSGLREADSQSRREILLESVPLSGNEDPQDLAPKALRTLRGNIPANQRRRSKVLQSEMFGDLDRAETAEAVVNNEQGLCHAVPTGQSDVQPARVCLGASFGNVGIHRPTSNKEGGRPPSQRAQIEQRSLQPCTNDQEGARPATERATSNDGELSALPQADKAEQCCPKCGGALTRTERPGVVLDPFMGSGSTGKAAVLEGLSFIGIDQDAEYVEIARLRIEAAGKQGQLF